MSCSQFELWVVSDDPVEQLAAEEHAGACPRCSAILANQRRLSNEVQGWRSSFEVPPDLENRVVEALKERAKRAGVKPFEAPEPLRIGPWIWALAAALALGIGLGMLQFELSPRAPQTANRLLIEDALAAAEVAEEQHAEAIARLEVAAGPILARAENLDLEAHEAARLMAYRDRLAYLDATIEEIRGYVDSNPGQARARSVLLAAYQEKTQVLREVVALEERS
jgi:hypothetical protein